MTNLGVITLYWQICEILRCERLSRKLVLIKLNQNFSKYFTYTTLNWLIHLRFNQTENFDKYQSVYAVDFSAFLVVHSGLSKPNNM